MRQSGRTIIRFDASWEAHNVRQFIQTHNKQRNLTDTANVYPSLSQIHYASQLLVKNGYSSSSQLTN